MTRYFKSIFKSLSRKKETNIDRWFTRDEQFLLMEQIKQMLELTNFRIGDADDQVLLITLLEDELMAAERD